MSATLRLTQALIRRSSVSPDDAGCQDLLAERLQPLGFRFERLDFADTRNCWLRRGQNAPLLVFLGHTDVVPPGPLSDWRSPPFEPSLHNGILYGRGSADMKGAIAAFTVAVERFLEDHPAHRGSIAVFLTSDEEGPAVNGIVKAVEVLSARGENITWCLVGEPSCDKNIGDVIRVGRRGSLNADLTVFGVQGHVAYPHLADNPVHRLAPALKALTEEIWDRGNAVFPPTTFQIAAIHAGTGAENIIPGKVRVQFNFRFSPELSEESIKQRVHALLDRHHLRYDCRWRLSGNPFVTAGGRLIEAAHRAVAAVTGLTPKNDTGGGTSDGRFIAPTGAEVIELGVLNASIHKVDEHVAVADLEILTDIYRRILDELLA